MTAPDLDSDSGYRAWLRVEPNAPQPIQTDLLKPSVLEKRSKSFVFRIHGVGPNGSPIIAKLCKRNSGLLERSMYQDVLSLLPIDSLGYYGSVCDPGSDFVWLFMEDAGEDDGTSSIDVHRVFASGWLGKFHAASNELGQLSFLPLRNGDFFLEHLCRARERILNSLAIRSWDDDARKVLRSVEGTLGYLANKWDRIEQSWSSLPHSVAHGDFRPRHVRPCAEESRIRIGVWDWEWAGWGPIALDIATIRAHQSDERIGAYLAGTSATWPHLTSRYVTLMGEFGALLRRVSAVYWATASLGIQDAQWAVNDISLYNKDLADGLYRRVWRF